MAEVQVIDIGETEVDGHQRHREGGEELQHGGTEEGKTQHLHGAFAKIFRRIANGIPFRLGAHEELQGAQPLQAIEEVAGETGQRLEVAAVGIGGADPTRIMKRGMRGAVPSRIRPAAQLTGNTATRITTGMNTAIAICGR